MKSTYFSLRLFDIYKEMDRRCSKWVDDVFVDKKDYLSESLLTSNLKSDLDYFISQLLWIFALATENGFDVKDHEDHIKNIYDVYTKSDDGYKDIIFDNRYNRHKHRLYTEEERNDLNKKMDDLVKEIIDENIQNHGK